MEASAVGRFQIMPVMSDEEFSLLKADIAKNGIRDPIVFDQNDNIIDGHHRFRAFAELIDAGADLPMFPRIQLRFDDDDERLDAVLSYNLVRRHLDQDGRRQVVFTLRKRGWTLSRIAEKLNTSIKTVSLDMNDLTDAEKAELEQAPRVASDGRVFNGSYAPRLDIKIQTGEQQLARAQTIIKGEEAPAARESSLDELRQKWGVERGQIWLVPSKNRPGQSHRIMCGSSLERDDVAKLMAGSFARLAVTSPPYNQLQTFVERMKTDKGPGMFAENTAFHERMESAYGDNMDEGQYQAEQVLMLSMAHLYMTDDAAFFYNHKLRYRNAEVVAPTSWILNAGWKWRSEVIWDRGSSITLNARMFIPADERIYWLVKDPSNFYFTDTTEVRAWTTVWQIAARNEVNVSAPFPNEIARRCIIAGSEMGDVVLEPYCGSGTTPAECERASRICYAMELDPRYVAVTLQRLSDMGLTPELVK